MPSRHMRRAQIISAVPSGDFSAQHQSSRSHASALQILESTLLSHNSSTVPLTYLASIIATEPGPWPALQLIRCYNKAWRALPEEAKGGRGDRYSTLVEKTLSQVKNSYGTLINSLHGDSKKPAIFDTQGGGCITHEVLYNFVLKFHLPITTSTTRKPVIALALPNGSLLALACLAVATYYTATPISSSGGAEQFRLDVQLTQAQVILVCRADVTRLELDAPWISHAGIEVLIVDQNSNMTFTTTRLNRPTSTSLCPRIANGPDDLGFILFTSGTSGTKKVVPLTIHSMLSSVAFVVESWDLKESDCCLNMMPLNHV